MRFERDFKGILKKIERARGGFAAQAGVLQSKAPAFRPWRQATSRGLLAEKR